MRKEKLAQMLSSCLRLVKPPRRRVCEQDLNFLAAQSTPLLYQAVARRLGETNAGPGPFYAYPFMDKNETVEFWITPPAPPDQVPSAGLPVEISLVAIKHGAKRMIVWPEEMKTRSFEEAVVVLWPQKRRARRFLS